ncbi:pyridoxamine 5'-phosphate oxidase [Geobacter sp. OR-1]|uniref:pyridoxamine 5'-phosphate oxidase family protein n=1 Tax=Geobacter sp. OR-1 TaxID=1266765 RepID=UPI00054390CF|nr:pyridoxamine 5'-phosphate oxidase family protein [Geobacter sp. OR-1]GAM10288.1 pyridoxamine 5'-phosphate oxidase [Geobacter sp. OR-1]
MPLEQRKSEITGYANGSRFATLAYIRHDGSPVLRTLGSFALADYDVIFSTKKGAAKVRDISENNRVSFYFEHDGQELSNWKNALFIGEAHTIEEQRELDWAVGILSDRNPRFKDRIAKGELPNIQLFKVKTRDIEYIDYGKGPGHVEKFTLSKEEEN